MFSIRQNFTQRSTRLPKKSQLLTIDTAYLGQPFVEVVGKNENTLGLDVSYNAQPFVAASNNRLTGPTIAVSSNHLDVQNWLNTISWNGGSASNTTITALNTFCAAIDNAGIRNKFYRLNLFCGNNLQACLVPLYVSQVPLEIGRVYSTNYGFSSDMNYNFLSSDYTETGVSGGLTPNGSSSKRLDTGLTQIGLGVSSCHLSVYEKEKPSGSYKTRIGSRGASINNEHLLTNTTTDLMYYGSSATGGNHRAAANSYSETGAFWIGINTSATNSVLYKNSTQQGTATPLTRTAQNSNYWVFALNDNGVTGDGMTTGKLASYSIGLSMDSTQVTAYYNAIQAFQTSLTRNV
jgi:hypothetical protein